MVCFVYLSLFNIKPMKNFLNKNKVPIVILLFWLFVHFFLLLLAEGSKSEFFPFSESSLRDSYDITEFVVYGITPILIFVGIKILNNEE